MQYTVHLTGWPELYIPGANPNRTRGNPVDLEFHDLGKGGVRRWKEWTQGVWSMAAPATWSEPTLGRSRPAAAASCLTKLPQQLQTHVRNSLLSNQTMHSKDLHVFHRYIPLRNMDELYNVHVHVLTDIFNGQGRGSKDIMSNYDWERFCYIPFSHELPYNIEGKQGVHSGQKLQ